jgi:hypothetical protein
VYGAAPRDILLPRSEVPAQLTFHLDGYDDGETQIVPTTDDTLRVKLVPRGRSRHARGGDKKPATTAAPHTPTQPPTGETLPNPY